MKKILAINPGSTSTKIAIYEGEKPIFIQTLRHSIEDIQKFESVAAQFKFREDVILKSIKDNNFDINELDAIVGRGGLLKPLISGTYFINDKMIEDLTEAKRGEHASNLGAVIASKIAEKLNIPSYIVDPVSVDEMEDIARISGMPGIERPSLFHALNQKAVARHAAKDLNKDYNELNLIVAHMGGGISVGAHKQGNVVDVNNALDGDGPMSPERSGSVPLGPLYKRCFSGDYTLDDIKKMNYGNGGLVGYLGTNSGPEVRKLIENGDENAKLIYQAMAYQIAKEIGSCATVLKGNVDAIVLTGGLAYDNVLVGWIKESISFISDIIVYPGEDEMLSLVQGALRVLKGEEVGKTYN